MAETLEQRVVALEKKQSGRFRFFFQYLAAPLLLAIFGGVITYLVGKEQRDLAQIEIAQKMVPTLFSADKFHALVTKRLLDALVTDEALQESLDQIVDEYTQAQIATAIESDNIQATQQILAAATAAGGTSGARIVTTIENNQLAMEKLTRYEQARPHELSALEAVSANQLQTALEEIKQAEQIYPTLHSVREIRTLIESKQDSLDDPATQELIREKIVNDYSWQVPEETLEKMRGTFRADGGVQRR